MKRSILQGAVLLTIASLVLAACGGGGGGHGVLPNSPSQPPPTFNYTGPQSLSVAWASQYAKEAQYLGPLSHEMVMSVSVNMQPQNGAGLVQYAQQASTPGSAAYRRFLTPAQIGQQFGASPSSYAAAASYFESYHLSVGGWPQHLMLAVAGTTTNLGKAFGTTFGWYRLGTQTFVAPVSAPHLSQPEAIGAVVGLSGYNADHAYIIRPSNSAFAGLSPQQLARGFDFTGAYGNGISGSGITVGVVGTGPIDTSANGDGALLAAFYHSSLAPIAIATVEPQPASTANNGTGTGAFDFNPAGLASPPPVTGPCAQPTPFGAGSFAVPNYQTCNSEDGEAQLDTQSIASLAPGSNVEFYLAFNDGTCVDSSGVFHLPVNGVCPGGDYIYQEEGIQLTDDEIQQAIADNTVDALSLSYGEGEPDAQYYGYWGSTAPYTSGPGPLEFAALAAEGIAVFVSSGDTGNQSCFDPTSGLPLTAPCVSYPASDVSVTSVGGVNIPLDNAGNVVGQITAWADTTTNGGDGTFGNNIGSGGGLSQFFSEPSWQNGLTVAANASPASAQLDGMRAVPDVSMDADPLSGPAIAINAEFGGGVYDIGGTSAAAPEMAAVWALVLQACKASASCATATGAKPYRLGIAASTLYSIYNGKGQLPYASTIYDVLYGENQANLPAGAQPPASVTGCCTAGAGYDMVTGVGAPSVGHLIQSATGTVTP